MRRRVLFVSLALISGCAGNADISADTQGSSAAQIIKSTDLPTEIKELPADAVDSPEDKSDEKVAVEPEAKVSSQASNADSGKTVILDPLHIDFDPMSVKLDALGVSKVLALLDRAKSASSISVRGFCDRNKVANAKAAAIARANAVKDQFVNLGVPEEKIKTFFFTNKPGSYATISLQ